VEKTAPSLNTPLLKGIKPQQLLILTKLEVRISMSNLVDLRLVPTVEMDILAPEEV